MNTPPQRSHERPPERAPLSSEPRFHSPSPVIDVVVGIAIVALFTNIERSIGPAKLTAFDSLAAISVGLITLRGFVSPLVAIGPLYAMAAYFYVYLVSAFFSGSTNGLKEAVQLLIIAGFLFCVFGYYRTRHTRTVFNIVLALSVIVLLYNIFWHVNNGYTVGWKRLDNPKTVFVIMPILLIMAIQQSPDLRRFGQPIILTGLVACLILLSGERKAFLIGVAALLIWLGPMNPRLVISAAVGIPLVFGAAAFDTTGYVQRQISSIAADDAGDMSIAALVTTGAHTSLSNAQREVSHRTAHRLWVENPVFGIGTNQFSEIMNGRTELPKEFRHNIHGEFRRALYENGVVGLILYVAAWTLAFLFIGMRWLHAFSQSERVATKIATIILITFMVYCAYEASKAMTILAFTAIPLVVAVRPKFVMQEPIK